MIVYIVTWGFDRETSISKVFDTEDKAKEFCEEQNSLGNYSYEEFEVE